MKLDKVYLGYTKNGDERLLYKTLGFLSVDSTYTVFVDLETGKRFDIGGVDTRTLIPFKEVFKFDKKHASKRKVVKTYAADRNQLIDLKKLCYVDIATYTTKSVTEDVEGIVFDVNGTQLTRNEIKNNVLVIENEDNYQDFRTGKVYSGFNYNNATDNSLCIDSIYMIERESEPLSKRKILKYDYRKEL